MNVLSLFGGISCGRLALERANIEVEKYYASEICPHAIKVSSVNFPDTIHLGDISQWKTWEIDWSKIDLILGGFCCQSFSLAGKQGGFDDDRGKLFFVTKDIINHVKKLNPKVKFLLENTKMKPEYLNYISDILGVSPVFINSNLVSAQSRQRYYWFNWKNNFKLPEDKNILFKDIIDSGIVEFEKAYCLTRTCPGNARDYFKKHQTNIVFEPNADPNISGFDVIDGEIHIVFKKSPDQSVYKFKVLVPDGNYVLRSINENEYERLQNLPDNYTASIPRTRRMEAIGNGWTVDVITHILSFL